MGAYYELIMSPNEGMFSHCFNLCWNEKLDSITRPYSDAIQLRIGNQLRPKLTCWGAALNTDRPEELDLRNIAQIASCVEMLHKASVIIDDLIDNDDARHGQKAFHIEFGHDNTVIFALTLLGRGMAGLNDVFMGSKGHCKSVALYSETIYRMAEGCLQELALDHTSRYDLHRIRNIIELETITLIKNSFCWVTGQTVTGTKRLKNSSPKLARIAVTFFRYSTTLSRIPLLIETLHIKAV